MIVDAAMAESDFSMHIVTSADQKFFPLLLNFIGSIHKVNFNELGEISIFDLGFNDEQRQILESIEKVHVYPIEQTNPDILKYLPRYRDCEQLVRGLYSWKPVAIKQALDMFDCIMYIDAGSLILKPLNDFFDYIRNNGYFFTTCGHSIGWMTTKYVAQKFDLYSKERAWILAPTTFGMQAGIQGLTRAVYDSYVLPMYELSKDIRNFVDDGTTPEGFGTGRHDQTLFSIYARLCNFHIHDFCDSFEVNSKKISFCIRAGCMGNILPQARVPNNTYNSYIHYKQKS